VAIVYGNQATTYTNRTRQNLWSIRPSFWLVVSSIVDIAIASTLAIWGIAMMRLPLLVLGETLVLAGVFAVIVDIIKVPVFRRLRIA
jgi:H+-transporting ATPase